MPISLREKGKAHIPILHFLNQFVWHTNSLYIIWPCSYGSEEYVLHITTTIKSRNIKGNDTHSHSFRVQIVWQKRKATRFGTDIELKNDKATWTRNLFTMLVSSVVPSVCWYYFIFGETILLTAYVMQIEAIWISTRLKEKYTQDTRTRSSSNNK